MKDFLDISEIFISFQGESTFVGRTTIFIRLASCNLRCKDCDTKYAFKKSYSISVNDLVTKISKFKKIKYVCITGGEPLLQITNLKKLFKHLLKENKIISIETNGSIPIKNISKKIKKVIDVKTPSTKEVKSFNLENIKHMSSIDELKFLISDYKDFIFSINFIKKHKLENRTILFSPNLAKRQTTKCLSNWIIKNNVNAIFQPQIHKLVKEEKVML